MQRRIVLIVMIKLYKRWKWLKSFYGNASKNVTDLKINVNMTSTNIIMLNLDNYALLSWKLLSKILNLSLLLTFPTVYFTPLPGREQIYIFTVFPWSQVINASICRIWLYRSDNIFLVLVMRQWDKILETLFQIINQ